MAKECSICHHKIGRLEDNGVISDGDHKEIICYSCWYKLYQLGNAKDIDTLDEEKKKLLDFVETQGVSDDILKLVNCEIEEIEKEKAEEFEEEYRKREIEKITLQKKQDEQDSRKRRMQEFSMNTLITTGYSFNGYRITKYCGVVSGEVVLGTGFLSEFSASINDLFGTQSDTFASKMAEAKNAALRKLINKMIEVGGNAIIGVDFDYINFSNNMIGVSANGTSVVVKKIEE